MAFVPERVVSLQPSVTSTLEQLGVLDRLVACTRYCVDVCPALKNAPRMKMIVADSWTASSSEILAAKPDLVIASVPYQLEAVAEILKAGIPFLGFAPHSLRDVYADISHIASIMRASDRGDKLIAQMRDEIETVRRHSNQAVALAGRPTVYCEEWGKPLIHSQAWVAELVEAAGGTFVGVPGAHCDAEDIRRANPDVIAAAWCGAGDRVPLEKLISSRGWGETKAGRDSRVYCINDEFLNTPGPTLMSGLHALAAVIHPKVFPEVNGVRRIAASLKSQK